MVDTILSTGYFAHAGSEVQVYAYLLTICCRSIEETWRNKGRVVISKKNIPLPAWRWQRV